MAFIDGLRDTESGINYHYRFCAEKYINCIYEECNKKKNMGIRRISGYPTLDCDSDPDCFISELPGHTGTAQARAAYHKKCSHSIGRYNCDWSRGVHHQVDLNTGGALLLKNISEARKVKALVDQQLRKDGFTNFNVKIAPYYETEYIYNIGVFMKYNTMSETGNVFYYLHITVEW